MWRNQNVRKGFHVWLCRKLLCSRENRDIYHVSFLLSFSGMKSYWSSPVFDLILFFILIIRIFVKWLMRLIVRWSSHSVTWGFYGRALNVDLVRSFGISPVSYSDHLLSISAFSMRIVSFFRLNTSWYLYSISEHCSFSHFPFASEHYFVIPLFMDFLSCLCFIMFRISSIINFFFLFLWVLGINSSADVMILRISAVLRGTESLWVY